ncbi:MAG TPA: D-arabinono-1,4-lactone oxidase, partial [Roseiflexaceae bacterium]|nr:D-arabinono-1,4-lactone oxidase [Roseiflexaceae bacterium]
KYGHLGVYLHGEGYAIHNMASLPHISVAGAIASATHGSGVENGNLATAVSGLEFVAANGELVTLSREQHGDEFDGAVVHLGALGILTKVTLDLSPTFLVRQDVYENLPLAQLEANFDEIQAHAYSVSLFTDWQNERVNQIWLKRRMAESEHSARVPSFFEATLAPANRHPLTERSAEPCTDQIGGPGPWNERLPHFRMEHTPSNGEELQTEYFVPIERGVEALRAVANLRDQIAPLLYISEVRAVAADSLWMSQNYQRRSLAIHFTWKLNWPDVSAFLPTLEAALEPFEARPHWGKLFTMAPERVQSLYERLPDFRALAQRYDPEGKFHNSFLERYIFS